MARLDDFYKSDRPVKLDQWFTFFAFNAVGEVIFSKSFVFFEHGKDIRNAILNRRLLACYAAVMGYYICRLLTFLTRVLRPSIRKWLDTRAKYPDRIEEIKIFATAVGTLSASGETDKLDAAKARGQLSPIVQHIGSMQQLVSVFHESPLPVVLLLPADSSQKG
ncbi:hypothetical protein N7475_007742 [Penicillium sp. IBT 31633x]|nr:hypothetical protein N7475_007742 [Penicillium sp. IBT 31633x]